MTTKIEFAEQVKETFKNTKLRLQDVFYDLPQYVHESRELESMWNDLVMQELRNELESVDNPDMLKMGDIYVAKDAKDTHSDLTDDVYEIAKNKGWI